MNLDKTGMFVLFATAISLIATTALSAPQSDNYRLRWSVLDAGGGVASSANYRVAGSVESTAVGSSSSTNYALVSGFQSVPDTDSDTVRDVFDNCVLVANPDQLNANSGVGPGTDIYGNVCDADLDESGFVNFTDLAMFRAAFGTTDPEANFDGVGIVNFGDLATFRALFGATPGPSGLPSD